MWIYFQPKKDQCEYCTSYANTSKEEKNTIKEKYNQHLKVKKMQK